MPWGWNNLSNICFLGKFWVTLFRRILGYIVQNIKLRNLPHPVNMNRQIGEGSRGGRPVPNYWRQKENSKGILAPARPQFLPSYPLCGKTVTRGCKINPKENSALNLVCKASSIKSTGIPMLYKKPLTPTMLKPNDGVCGREENKLSRNDTRRTLVF